MQDRATLHRTSRRTSTLRTIGARLDSVRESLSRAGRVAPLLLAAIPLVFLSVSIARYEVDVPFWDHWLFPPMLKESYEGTLSFESFWEQHNEHRPVFPRIAMLVLARLTGWDVSYELGLSVSMATGILAAFYYLTTVSMRSTGRRPTRWLLPLASLIVFSLAQWENWLWGWNLMIVMNVCAVVVGIALLAGEELSWIRLIGGVTAGIVATYSFANGLLYWLVGLPVLLVSSSNRKRAIAVWVTAAAASLASYMYRYHKPSYHPSLWEAATKPLEYARYVLGYLGAPLVSTNLAAAPIEGLLGLLAVCVLVWLLARRGHHLRTLVPFAALALYAVGSALITGIGRVGFGSDQAFTSRYTTISSLLWLAIPGLLCLLVDGGGHGFSISSGNVVEKVGALVFVVALVVLVGASSVGALSSFRGWHEFLVPAREAMIAAEAVDADYELLGRLFADTGYLMAQRSILDEYGLSVFRDMPSLCSADRECLTLADYALKGRRFSQGQAVPINVALLAPDLLTPSIWLRIRVVRDPRLPWLETTSIVVDTFELLVDRSNGASPKGKVERYAILVPRQSAMDGPYRVLLPLVLRRYPTKPQLHLLTLPAILSLPEDAPTGRAQVMLEIVGSDGQAWRTASGQASLPLSRFTVVASRGDEAPSVSAPGQ